jgi:hypothetical protein
VPPRHAPASWVFCLAGSMEAFAPGVVSEPRAQVAGRGGTSATGLCESGQGTRVNINARSHGAKRKATLFASYRDEG